MGVHKQRSPIWEHANHVLMHLSGAAHARAEEKAKADRPGHIFERRATRHAHRLVDADDDHRPHDAQHHDRDWRGLLAPARIVAGRDSVPDSSDGALQTPRTDRRRQPNAAAVAPEVPQGGGAVEGADGEDAEEDHHHQRRDALCLSHRVLLHGLLGVAEAARHDERQQLLPPPPRAPPRRRTRRRTGWHHVSKLPCITCASCCASRAQAAVHHVRSLLCIT
jgi:hypothetical protein